MNAIHAAEIVRPLRNVQQQEFSVLLMWVSIYAVREAMKMMGPKSTHQQLIVTIP